jgi:hypothetical protein
LKRKSKDLLKKYLKFKRENKGKRGVWEGERIKEKGVKLFPALLSFGSF